MDDRGRAIRPSRVVLRDGRRIEVAAAGAGEGPALLLIPGLSGDKESFLYQVPVLSQAFRVLAMDLRAVSGNEPDGLDIFVGDAAEVLDAFGEPSASLLGLSFGGAVAMRFAAVHPERTTALVLVNTLTHLDRDLLGLDHSLLSPLAYFTTRFAPAAAVGPLARLWGRFGVWVYDPSEGNARVVRYQLTSASRAPLGASARRLALLRGRDLREDLPRVAVPTLVVHGATDRYCPEEWSREIAALVPGAEFAEIPGAGHLCLMSRAETFNRLVLRWLATHLGERPEAG